MSAKNDMLGPITRALVGVPPQHHGLILDLVNKLGGEHGNTFHSRIARAARASDWDSTLCVDRSKLYASTWKLKHPELQTTGPDKYSLAELEQFLPESYNIDNANISGLEIYRFLKKTDSLKNCLNLRDGEEMTNRGIDWFRQRFPNRRSVAMWKSISLGKSEEDGAVPTLSIIGELCGATPSLQVTWEHIGNKFQPPLMFYSSLVYCNWSR